MQTFLAAPKGFEKLDMCSGVDGMMWFIRDGAGRLYWFGLTGGPREPSALELKIYVRDRKWQIQARREREELAITWAAESFRIDRMVAAADRASMNAGSWNEGS